MFVVVGAKVFAHVNSELDSLFSGREETQLCYAQVIQHNSRSIDLAFAREMHKVRLVRHHVSSFERV